MEIKQYTRNQTYSRRESRITTAQRRALVELLDEYSLPYTDEKINITQVFYGVKRFCIEIGFGDGRNLLDMAVANSQTGYLGIEVYRPGVGKCLRLLHKNNIANVRISTADARDVLNRQIPAESVDEIYILFPDPWPKLRHHKRRLIDSDFVNVCASRMAIDGTLSVATDSKNYAERILELLQQCDKLRNLAECEGFAKAGESQRLQTRYERKATENNHTVYDMIFRRVI